MSLSLDELRRRVADAVTATLGEAGWTESTYAFDLFPRDARDLAHLAFAVGLPSSSPAELDRQSTRRGSVVRQAVTTTAVVVRWTSGLPADDQVAAYGGFLAAERDLVSAVLALDGNPDLGIRWARSSRAGTVGE
ncbi:MAG: hypothetical protein ABMA64_35910, partial [Myxococcota bacterium]